MKLNDAVRVLAVFFLSIILAAFVVSLFGCRLGSGPVTPRPQATAEHVKLVDRVFDYTNERAWQRSGYWRIDDRPGGWPWFAVISGDGTACPAWDHELYVPRRGEYYQCKSSWRIWRNPR